MLQIIRKFEIWRNSVKTKNAFSQILGSQNVKKSTSWEYFLYQTASKNHARLAGSLRITPKPWNYTEIAPKIFVGRRQRRSLLNYDMIATVLYGNAWLRSVKYFHTITSGGLAAPHTPLLPWGRRRGQGPRTPRALSRPWSYGKGTWRTIEHVPKSMKHQKPNELKQKYKQN